MYCIAGTTQLLKSNNTTYCWVVNNSKPTYAHAPNTPQPFARSSSNHQKLPGSQIPTRSAIVGKKREKNSSSFCPHAKHYATHYHVVNIHPVLACSLDPRWQTKKDRVVETNDAPKFKRCRVYQSQSQVKSKDWNLQRCFQNVRHC